MREKEALEYLNSFDLFKVDLRLDRIQQFLEFSGNSQQKFRSVIVAGTNGKGSVSAFLAGILNAAGKKTGLYLSPHVRSLNERIQVNGEKISGRELAGLVEKLKKAKEESKSDVSYFEFLTALAFAHFAEKGCEIAVLEVGMGGRLDATNVANAELSIITNVALEHTQHLGSSLALIAAEKAGVIKRNAKVVTGELAPEARAVVEKTAAEKNAGVIALGKDFSFSERHSVLDGQEFDFFRGEKKIPGLKTRLVGKNQFKNAALAVAAALELGIKEECIHNGLLNAELPARFEVFSKSPLAILDVAHNPEGMRSLAENLRMFFPVKKVNFVLGVSGDKDIKGILAELVPLAGSFILTKAKFRGMDTEKISVALGESGFEGGIRAKESVPAAVRLALAEARSGIPTVFTGSFFSVGEALRELERVK